ncbi:hypothetical protein J5I95_15780 [Candidatus Poribacteria bacterium]|nr:hypothetical protein [Candidatus Poribacteria bacterium]
MEMKIFVFSLFAIFVTTFSFLSCERTADMMTLTVKDTMNSMQPSVVSITHYRKRERPDYSKTTTTIGAGYPVYTVVTFSDNVPLVVADDESARPDIRAIINGNETQFHIVPYGSSGENFWTGDAKPIDGTRVFLCKYILPSDSIGTFSVVTAADMIEPPLPLKIIGATTDDPDTRWQLRAISGFQSALSRFSEPCEKDVGKSLAQLVEEEFEIAYNADIGNHLYQIIREEKNLQSKNFLPDANEIDFEFTSTAYLRLRLEFPEKNSEEIFELFREIVRNTDLHALIYHRDAVAYGAPPLPKLPFTPPEKALETGEPENLLAERVTQVFRRFSSPCDEDIGKDLYQLIEEEFEIKYDPDIQNYLYQIIREEKNIQPEDEEWKTVTNPVGRVISIKRAVINLKRTLTEYLKLRLGFPDESLEEIFELFHEAVRNTDTNVFIYYEENFGDEPPN